MIKEFNCYLDKIPNWIRWIIFLPVSILISTIVGWVSSISSFLYIKPSWIYLFNSYIVTAIFLLLSIIIVPKYKFIVSLILTIIITFMSSSSIFIIYSGYVQLNHPLWLEIVGRIIIIIAAVVITIYVHKFEEELNSYKSKNPEQEKSFDFNKMNESNTQTNFTNNLPINKLVYIILRNFRDIDSVNDLIELLPDNCLKDISDSEFVNNMNVLEPKIKGHTNKFFKFIGTQGIYGVLDMDFIDNKLMNTRIQLFFNKVNTKNKKIINDYMKNIKKLIEELSEVNLDDKVYPYYEYSGKSKEELVIGIRKVPGTDSISITICEDTPMEDIPFLTE